MQNHRLKVIATRGSHAHQCSSLRGKHRHRPRDLVVHHAVQNTRGDNDSYVMNFGSRVWKTVGASDDGGKEKDEETTKHFRGQQDVIGGATGVGLDGSEIRSTTRGDM